MKDTRSHIATRADGFAQALIDRRTAAGAGKVHAEASRAPGDAGLAMTLKNARKRLQDIKKKAK